MHVSPLEFLGLLSLSFLSLVCLVCGLLGNAYGLHILLKKTTTIAAKMTMINATITSLGLLLFLFPLAVTKFWLCAYDIKNESLATTYDLIWTICEVNCYCNLVSIGICRFLQLRQLRANYNQWKKVEIVLIPSSWVLSIILASGSMFSQHNQNIGSFSEPFKNPNPKVYSHTRELSLICAIFSLILMTTVYSLAIRHTKKAFPSNTRVDVNTKSLPYDKACAKIELTRRHSCPLSIGSRNSQHNINNMLPRRKSSLDITHLVSQQSSTVKTGKEGKEIDGQTQYIPGYVESASDRLPVTPLSKVFKKTSTKSLPMTNGSYDNNNKKKSFTTEGHTHEGSQGEKKISNDDNMIYALQDTVSLDARSSRGELELSSSTLHLDGNSERQSQANYDDPSLKNMNNSDEILLSPSCISSKKSSATLSVSSADISLYLDTQRHSDVSQETISSYSRNTPIHHGHKRKKKAKKDERTPPPLKHVRKNAGSIPLKLFDEFRKVSLPFLHNKLNKVSVSNDGDENVAPHWNINPVKTFNSEDQASYATDIFLLSRKSETSIVTEHFLQSPRSQNVSFDSTVSLNNLNRHGVNCDRDFNSLSQNNTEATASKVDGRISNCESPWQDSVNTLTPRVSRNSADITTPDSNISDYSLRCSLASLNNVTKRDKYGVLSSWQMSPNLEGINANARVNAPVIRIIRPSTEEVYNIDKSRRESHGYQANRSLETNNNGYSLNRKSGVTLYRQDHVIQDGQVFEAKRQSLPTSRSNSKNVEIPSHNISRQKILQLRIKRYVSTSTLRSLVYIFHVLVTLCPLIAVKYALSVVTMETFTRLVILFMFEILGYCCFVSFPFVYVISNTKIVKRINLFRMDRLCFCCVKKHSSESKVVSIGNGIASK